MNWLIQSYSRCLQSIPQVTASFVLGLSNAGFAIIDPEAADQVSGAIFGLCEKSVLGFFLE